MKRLVVISGPQAAGKSSAIKTLQELLGNIYPCFPGSKDIVPLVLQEARQIIVHKYHAMGAIFLTEEQEREIIKIDFYRMKKILSELDERLLYFDECNIFTLAHAKAHGVELPDGILSDYIEHLSKLKAAVIFLDISPDLSWERRKDSYCFRLYRFPEGERDGILDRYRRYLDLLHPALLDIFEKIDLPKIKIDAGRPAQDVMRSIVSSLKESNVI
jgi:thymidylate kinase